MAFAGGQFQWSQGRFVEARPAARPGSGRVLLFRVGPQLCCADIAEVAAIIRGPEVTRVPLAPRSVVGLLNHRSQAVTAIGLRSCLGLPEAEPERGYVLLVEVENELVGFSVDEVLDIVPATGDSWERAPENASLPFSDRVLVREEGLFCSLEFDRIVSLLEGRTSPEALSFEAAGAGSPLPSPGLPEGKATGQGEGGRPAGVPGRGAPTPKPVESQPGERSAVEPEEKPAAEAGGQAAAARTEEEQREPLPAEPPPSAVNPSEVLPMPAGEAPPEQEELAAPFDPREESIPVEEAPTGSSGDSPQGPEPVAAPDAPYAGGETLEWQTKSEPWARYESPKPAAGRPVWRSGRVARVGIPLLAVALLAVAVGVATLTNAPAESPAPSRAPLAEPPVERAPSGPRPAPSARQAIIHEVVPGDTLSELAGRYLGDIMRYPELAAHNGIENPDLIYVGQTVRIPAEQVEEPTSP